MTEGKVLFGRKVIYTDFDRIDKTNVVKVLDDTIYQHQTNSADIQYLYDYYRGNQPILQGLKSRGLKSVIRLLRTGQTKSFRSRSAISWANLFSM